MNRKRRGGRVGWPSTAVLAWMRERLVAAGQAPSLVPDEPFHFMHREEVERRTGISRTSIYDGMAAGTFPEPVPLSGPITAKRLAENVPP